MTEAGPRRFMCVLDPVFDAKFSNFRNKCFLERTQTPMVESEIKIFGYYCFESFSIIYACLCVESMIVCVFVCGI